MNDMKNENQHLEIESVEGRLEFGFWGWIEDAAGRVWGWIKEHVRVSGHS